MRFHTRKWIKPEDLNPNGTLFGGVVIWDEELALYSIIQLENQRVVTKYMSEINFRSLQKTGRYYRNWYDVVKFGTTSLS
jgi:acyl-CoA hydrolase